MSDFDSEDFSKLLLKLEKQQHRNQKVYRHKVKEVYKNLRESFPEEELIKSTTQ